MSALLRRGGVFTGVAALLAVAACSAPVDGQAVAGPNATAPPSITQSAPLPEQPEIAPIPRQRTALPKRPQRLGSPARCTFRGSEQRPAEKVSRPRGKTAPARGTVTMTMRTSAGTIRVTMHRELAPCTVQSMLSLVRQRFYDDTGCHRLGTGADLQMLQCGDPNGDGSGGPGYTVPDEVFPQLKYGRGLVAMANGGQPDSGGSQFFLIFGDVDIPPSYTVFGRIDDGGLRVLDKVARGGVDPVSAQGGPGDGTGKPVIPVRLEKVTVTR